MNTYALYNPTTGAIVSILQCSPANAELQVRNGLALLMLPDGFTGKPDDYRVSGGKVVLR